MSGIRSIYRGPTVKGSASGASVPIYVDSDDNLLKIVPAGSGTTEVVVQSTIESILVPTVAVTLTSGQSGTNVFLGPTAGFAITLPAPAAGLHYKFTTAAAFATSNYTIITPTANIIFGGAIVNSVYVPADAEDTINIVATAETVGDFVELWSDGTNWLVTGVGALAGSITFTVT